MHWLDLTVALLTLAFGAFGFLAPRYTLGVLDLTTTSSTMGMSEMRASVGGLFVIAALGGLWMNDPAAWAMLGFAYTGAALGRVISLALDSPPTRKVLMFGGIEAALAAVLLVRHL
ncbi:DUF4345 family protein [Pseudaestuariivita sp.]|uniref:DUF4345 family protein n=1 Tax=Pseudaestuariivita sp. TaxID=2211669 RepID=UPI004058F78F